MMRRAMIKSLALVMAFVLLTTGCATAYAQYYSRPNTTEEERLADFGRCDNNNGLRISGIVISVVLFPIGLVVGIPMTIVASERDKSCMIKAGYKY